jgi:putative transposase
MLSNKKLSKNISDASWNMFISMLEYKSDWYGRDVFKVNPKYTSQTCSVCNYTSRANRKTQEKFECLACGHKENADINASKNILTVGQTGLACGENISFH